MFGIFKKKNRTALDELNESTVKMFRPFISKKMKDDEVLNIVQMTMKHFKQAAESKSEHLPGTVLLNISAKFICVYDQYGEKFFLEHLNYEIQKYLIEGLRADYDNGPFD